ncbi:SEC-C domain-containing protein [Kordia algicida OT-1]|uniref:SEC-C motif-containing protein n=1 Tax=Kordia algicida OT-1 TaxID=391587 RepID=A9DMB0_9FLAO|nr:SEC-C domain-containing protein [Kordia algicida]EDP97666.1 hypothetical protein KAOT1_20927 [Kordia algicida OT-1]
MKDEIDEVLHKYPKLKYIQNINSFIGCIEVFPNDFYELKIVLTHWKKNFPKVFETACRIPRHVDRHIYPKGNFCFTTSAKEQILLATEIKTLIDFIRYILVPYLKNNSYYEIEENYLYGEYSHDKGIFEGYAEILGVEDEKIIIKTIKEYATGFRLKLNDNCFCGSGKKLAKCKNRKHYKGYRKLRHINNETLLADIIIMESESMSKKMEFYKKLLGMKNLISKA